MTDTSSLTPSPWTPERVEEMTSMWLDGKSASICALALGNGISRSAVIGKVYRLGLHRNHSGRTTLRPAPRRRQGPRKPSTPRLWDRPEDDDLKEWRAIEAEMPVRAHRPAARIVDAPEHAGTDPVMIDDLRSPVRQCRHIEGEPTADALYCGAAVHPGSSYCPHHHHLCWVPHRRAA